MIRRVVALILVAAAIYAGWHVAVAWSHYRQFQDSVREVALFGIDKSDEVLRARVMELAAQNHIDVSPDAVTVQRRAGEVTIEARYTEAVKILPGYERQVDFTVK
ncbi:MAG TPA: hypothetical protein VL484_04220 [Vicinamibacterales bacterium]|jgi:hypothetical protein|nr:hypothetical protein [Vicinamibacterales bacterium]